METIREIRVGDQPRIEITVYKEDGTALNVSGASTKDFVIRKPDGEVVTKGATFVTDGLDGKLYYQTVQGDINLVGHWKLQVSLVLAIGPRKSSIVTFEVHPNL